ncbi:DUF4442 domain-containing protein [Marinobacter confluentis]|uniref:DUF4442 domain-containing protein n=1 Tax=Marinobacter confluentis TaxID=1697557 RepID=A0A4Z1C0E3_9GAMM|nr:DUF4442 domain-containing protein [Marinobacter confluentis]TGN40448.1 DUF4442 domain-containing protein [Marinobacter confluentis]
MIFNNRLSRTLSKIEKFPESLQYRLLTFMVGRTVPFVGTAGLSFEHLDQNKARLSLKSRKKVLNHINTIHAAAMALLAESATGMVFAMNVRDDCVYVLKSMDIDFVGKAKGSLSAEATLSEDACQAIRNTTKGEISVPVTVLDSEGDSPIVCKMVWAWRPKR